MSCLLFAGRRGWSGTELSEYLWSNWWSVFSFSVHLLGISGHHFLSWYIGRAVLLQKTPMRVEKRQVMSITSLLFLYPGPEDVFFFLLLKQKGRHCRESDQGTDKETSRKTVLTVFISVTCLSTWSLDTRACSTSTFLVDRRFSIVNCYFKLN